MRRTTELLARLEKHALDDQRIVVQALEAELGVQRDEIMAVERDLATQHITVWMLPGGPRHLAGYAAQKIKRQCSLREDTNAVAAALELAQAALRARLQSYKTLQEADKRRVEREAADMLRRDRAEVDEVGALRRASGPVAERHAS